MNRIKQHIEHVSTNRLIPEDSLVTIKYDSVLNPGTIPNHTKEYRAKLVLQTNYFLKEFENPEIYNYVRKRVLDLFTEEVYGGIRKPLYKVQKAILERDSNQALHLLGNIIDELYS